MWTPMRAVSCCSVLAALLLLAPPCAAQSGMTEVNEVPGPPASQRIAITNVRLIDGTGGPAVEDATVVVFGGRIAEAGKADGIAVPKGARVVDGKGLTLLPGLIDAHFHFGGSSPASQRRAALWLQNGITSLRDPGNWIAKYDPVQALDLPTPRLFLTGPHLDQNPAAYPHNAIILRDAEETRVAVNAMIDRGASAIKVYYRLPLGLIRVTAETAHARGVPVTAHLEIVDARDAVRAGLDGVEHATSFGSALLAPREAEKWRQTILADNAARRPGRYEIWSGLDLDSPQARGLYRLIADRGTFVSPTLAVFERRAGDENVTDFEVAGFAKMIQFVGKAHAAGAKIVVGSHGSVPHAEYGWSQQREMELLVEAGLSPMEAIVAATMENARFFRIEERLGSIEPGKVADLILVEGDPLENISRLHNVKRVMLNGTWVK